MTQNQIAYQNMLETTRSNRVREVETNRSNQANEIQRYWDYLENSRANLARETETHRANLATEGLRAQELSETQRSHFANELEAHRLNSLQAYNWEQQHADRVYAADTSAEASRYGSRLNYASNQNATAQRAEAAALQNEASHYSADSSNSANMYSADQRYNASNYAADVRAGTENQRLHNEMLRYWTTYPLDVLNSLSGSYRNAAQGTDSLLNSLSKLNPFEGLTPKGWLPWLR